MLQMKNIKVRNVLNDLNLNVREGEFILILGENGAGKTTLFNTISGNIFPERGRIFIDEEDVTNKAQYARSNLIANVFQDPKVGTTESMSIRDNLNLAYMRGKKRTLRNSCSADRDFLFREKLRELDMKLENRLDDYAGELSGGQRQALSILMALLTESKILLLDEITAALDNINSEKIMNIINEKCLKTKKTCLMITHNRDQIKEFGNKTMILKNGRLFER